MHPLFAAASRLKSCKTKLVREDAASWLPGREYVSIRDWSGKENGHGFSESGPLALREATVSRGVMERRPESRGSVCRREDG